MSPEKQRIAIAKCRLSPIRFLYRRSNRMAVWLFNCSCGNTTEASLSDVKRGHIKSCGCLRREVTSETKTKHGCAKRMHHTGEYRSWRGILNRCMSPTNPAFNDYGGRGICVCLPWLNSFSAFLRDMGPKPSPRHSIERINNESGYFPENCRWATPKEQAQNRRQRRWKKKPLTKQ